MGWKYEVETYWFEDDLWKTGYMGDSLFKAVKSLLRERKVNPGRAYRIVTR